MNAGFRKKMKVSKLKSVLTNVYYILLDCF